MQRVLIIRFSSFGDIVQCFASVPHFQQLYPQGTVHFLTRKEFVPLAQGMPGIGPVWSFERKEGMIGLYRLCQKLKKERFDVIYDAHRSLRTFLMRFFLLGPIPAFFPDYCEVQRAPHLFFISRSKERWKRFLLFRLKKNLFPKNYKGMVSYVRPLMQIGLQKMTFSPVTYRFPPAVLAKSESILAALPLQFVALAPSAAWEMKRWPLEHFFQLIEKLPKMKFVILGGPEDQFCTEFEKRYPQQVTNLAGKLNLLESCLLVQHCAVLVSADTGLLHFADLVGKKAVALIGPTAFGHTSGHSVRELSIDLPCRPCTKDGSGKCSQSVWRLCMDGIKPDIVAQTVMELF